MNNQRIISCIKHWGLSGYSSILTRIGVCFGGQVRSPQSATAYISDRWQQVYDETEKVITL